MKSLLLKTAAVTVIALLTVSISASAQEKGDMAVGGNLTLGTGDSFTNFGIGAKFQYNVTAPIRLEGAFTYFFEKDMISMWDFSVNGHYLFPVANKIAVYPLAGLGLLGVKVNMPSLGGYEYLVNASTSATKFGFNIGGGADYHITDKIVGNIELKYKLCSDWNRFLISAGVAYKF